MKYTAPATNKLLLEAGFGTYISQWGYQERPGNPTKNLVRVQEQSAQIFDRNGNRVRDGLRRLPDRRRQPEVPLVELADRLHLRAHLERVGQLRDRRAQHEVRLSGCVPPRRRQPVPDDQQRPPDAVQFNTPCNNASCPTTPSNRVTIQSGAFTRKVRTEYYAFFAQEQWTKDRLTLQGALRFDRAWSSSPSRRSVRPSPIPTAIVLPAQEGITGYNDLSPRIGVAYDVFGNGKTSLKANVGRYLHPASNQGRYINANPSERVVDDHQRGRGPTTTATSSPTAISLNGRAQSPATTGSIDTCGAWAIRTSAARGRARRSIRLDSRWMGRAAVRLAVRRVGAAGGHAESLGRGRLLPPVVADLTAAPT